MHSVSANGSDGHAASPSSDGHVRERQNRGVKLTLKCAAPKCQQRLLALHVNGTAVIDMILPCPKCKNLSSFEWTFEGVSTYLLAPNPRGEDASAAATADAAGIAAFVAERRT